MEPKQIEVYVEGMSQLLWQWRDSPNLKAFLGSLLLQLEKLQDTFYQLLNERGIYTAIGDQLDTLGRLVGELREGRGDDLYREAILARISVNAASGTAEDVKQTAKVLSGVNYVYIYEHFPACTYMFVPAFISRQNEIAIDTSHAAGVRTRVLWSEEPENVIFPGIEGDFAEINLITESGEELIVTTPEGEFTLVVAVTVTTVGESYFTSLVPGASSYEVVDDKGKLASLVPLEEVDLTTGYIIDQSGNYIVDNLGNYIRYINFAEDI